MNQPPSPLVRSRTDDSARRRRRVLKALDELTSDGQPISVSAVARHAGVHRSLIYRHTDLHATVAARATQPADGPAGPQVTRQSLLADLANLTDRNTRLTQHITRLTQHITRLEHRLSDTLGEQAWHASGLGAPIDIDTLQQRIEHLDQQVADLTSKLDDRDDDLAAARATNRELMTQLNSASRQRR